jgi:hypothetical protein
MVIKLRGRSQGSFRICGMELLQRRVTSFVRGSFAHAILVSNNLRQI